MNSNHENPTGVADDSRASDSRASPAVETETATQEQEQETPFPLTAGWLWVGALAVIIGIASGLIMSSATFFK